MLKMRENTFKGTAYAQKILTEVYADNPAAVGDFFYLYVGKIAGNPVYASGVRVTCHIYLPADCVICVGVLIALAKTKTLDKLFNIMTPKQKKQIEEVAATQDVAEQ